MIHAKMTHQRDVDQLSLMMTDLTSPMISDILADCELEDSCEDFSDFVDSSFLDSMATLHEQHDRGFEDRLLTASDFMNQDYGGEVIETDACLWCPDGELCPEEVLLEVEVITEWNDEEGERTLIDLDGGSKSPNSQTSTSDYGSDSGADHNTSEMDQSQTGSLDLSKTSSYTEQTSALDFSQAYTHTAHNGSLDMSHGTDIGYQGSRYMHCGGGSLVLNRSGEIEQQHNGLLDLSKTGSNFYQLPRIKLEPGLGIDPTIQYKPEMDFNHNEAFTTFSKMDSSLYNNHNHENDYVSKKEEIVYNNIPSDQTDTHCREEDLQTPQCQNIPLTVTSPEDDDNDSGTESSGSVISNKSNSNQNNRKRPGRKKGQVSKVYHLWEFIKDVLANPNYCPTVIKWENEEEGIFRVVQSEEAAKLWGAKKNNRTKMTYEKMSRSIRYSRKEGYFDDIPKDKGYPKKLCFKFGKKAYGWSQKYNR